MLLKIEITHTVTHEGHKGDGEEGGVEYADVPVGAIRGPANEEKPFAVALDAGVCVRTAAGVEGPVFTNDSDVVRLHDGETLVCRSSQDMGG